PGQMTHLVASLAPDSENSCVMQGASCTQSKVFMVLFILSDSFLPSILLLVIIVVTVVIVVVISAVVVVAIIGVVVVVVGNGVPSIIKISFVIVGSFSCYRSSAYPCVLSGSDIVDLTGDEDLINEDGDTRIGDSTGVLVSLGGEISSGRKEISGIKHRWRISPSKDAETPVESPIPISSSSSVRSSSPMPPKRTSTSAAPAMTQDAIWQLVANNVAAALEAQAANMMHLASHRSLHWQVSDLQQGGSSDQELHKQRTSHEKKPTISVCNLSCLWGERALQKSLNDKLNFVEELVEIMDQEVKQLRRSCIPIVKVRWNSEFTWEREDQIRTKYPHLFSNNTPSLN
ncbi:hypothetical protein Tco_0196693, partial [Tanacetum coccineum]